MHKHVSEKSLVLLVILTLVSIGFLERNYFAIADATETGEIASVSYVIHHEPKLPRITIPATTLRGGDDGGEVAELQKFLIATGFFPTDIEANGHFGPSTEIALKKYQNSRNLEETGALGPLTREAIKKDLN